jgi:hypothetical protein
MDRRDGDDARWAELRARPRWCVEDATWAMAAWAVSGETLASFGERHGVHPERLRRWRERLGTAQTETSLIAGRGRGPAAPAVALVPVSVRSTALPAMEGGEGAVVVTAGGVRVVVRDASATSPDWVARLLVQLSAAVAS